MRVSRTIRTTMKPEVSKTFKEKCSFKTSILIWWSGFLSSPLEANVHTDLIGATDLSSDLVNFFTIAAKNLQDYIPQILEQEDINLTTCSWQSKKKKKARRSRTEQLEK